MSDKVVKKIVKEGYAKIAVQGGSCCGPASSCCGSPNLVQDISRKIGYSDEELKAAPEGANLRRDEVDDRDAQERPGRLPHGAPVQGVSDEGEPVSRDALLHGPAVPQQQITVADDDKGGDADLAQPLEDVVLVAQGPGAAQETVGAHALQPLEMPAHSGRQLTLRRESLG